MPIGERQPETIRATTAIAHLRCNICLFFIPISEKKLWTAVPFFDRLDDPSLFLPREIRALSAGKSLVIPAHEHIGFHCFYISKTDCAHVLVPAEVAVLCFSTRFLDDGGGF